MTTTKHTPGPWVACKLAEGFHGYADWQTFTIRSPQNVCLATVGDVDRYESEKIPANARLIAASPTLYEACQAVLKAQQSHRWHVNSDEPDPFELVRTALAKATVG